MAAENRGVLQLCCYSFNFIVCILTSLFLFILSQFECRSATSQFNNGRQTIPLPPPYSLPIDTSGEGTSTSKKEAGPGMNVLKFIIVSCPKLLPKLFGGRSCSRDYHNKPEPAMQFKPIPCNTSNKATSSNLTLVNLY